MTVRSTAWPGIFSKNGIISGLIRTPGIRENRSKIDFSGISAGFWTWRPGGLATRVWRSGDPDLAVWRPGDQDLAVWRPGSGGLATRWRSWRPGGGLGVQVVVRWSDGADVAD